MPSVVQQRQLQHGAVPYTVFPGLALTHMLNTQARIVVDIVLCFSLRTIRSTGDTR